MNFLQKTYHVSLNFFKKIKTRHIFNNENENYLQLTDISDEQINKISKKFNVDMVCDSKNPHNQSQNNYNNSYYLHLLRIKSFYSNAKIFQALNEGNSAEHLYSDFKKYKKDKIFNQHINVINLINIKELEKNIHYLNNVRINCLVLETALVLDNVEMYHLVESLLLLQGKKVHILESMFFIVSCYGGKIKNSKLSSKIREHLSVDNFYQYNCENFYSGYSNNRPNKKHINNINDFFNIDTLDIIVNKELSYQEIKNLQLSYPQQKYLLKNIDVEKNYNVLLYFINENKYINVKKKLYWLHNNKLLNHYLWDKLLNTSYIGAIGIVFKNYDILKKLVEIDTLKKLIEKYKDDVLQFSLNFDTTMDFIKKYPFKLSKQELSQLIANAYVYCECRNNLEHDALELINSKYLGQITAPMGNLIKDAKKYDTILTHTNNNLNYLYKKYAEYLKAEDFLLSIVVSCKSDILLFCYLNMYFTDNDKDLKAEVAKKLYIFNHDVLSSDNMYGKTLTWVIENNLLDIVLDNNLKDNQIFISKSTNYLVPLLIEKYKIKPDYFLEKSVATEIVNEELFYFILNNYNIVKNEQNFVCKQVYIYNEVKLAEELFKKGFSPNEDLVDLMKEFSNCAGNILLKCYLKKKLENKNNSMLHKQKNKIKKI